MGVEAVLLDLYDTLAWSEWPRLRDLMEARLGVPEEELMAAFDRTRPARSAGAYPDAAGDMAAVVAACGVEPAPALVAELAELERAFLANGVHLYEDSLPVLRELRSRGVRIAVVSNCSHSTRPVVDRLELAGEVDATILSFEVGSAKPDAGIYVTALERIGVGAESALFVDDQEWYCDGAAAVGMPAVQIQRDWVFGEPTETGRHRVIAGLAELLS